MGDETSSGDTTHDLLLALAGRVDDDLLGRARELVAVGEDARAVELVTASLVACRAVLPEEVRAALVAAAGAARTDLDPATELPPSRPEDGTEHRFAEPPDDDPVAGALLALPARALTGCRVLLAHRRTPAGSAPGPLPHPVVLVQAPPGGRPTEVLAYQVAVALERAGVHASVEVLAAGTAPPEYHAAALRRAAAVIVPDDEPAAFAERPRPAPRPEPEPEPEQPPARRRMPDTARLLDPPLHSDELLGGLLPTTRRDPRPQQPEPESERDEPEPPRAAEDAGAPDPAPPRERLPFRKPMPFQDPVPFQDPPFQDRVQAEPVPSEDPGPADPATTSAMPATSLPTRRTAPVREPAADAPPASRPAPRPIPTPTGRIRRPTVTPIARASMPNPIPLVRRDGPAPIVRPLAPAGSGPDEPEPVDERMPDAHVDDVLEETGAEPEPRAADGAVPAFDSLGAPLGDPLNDPLSDPLDEPLLAPLLDPTVHEEDPLGVAGRAPDAGPSRRARSDGATTGGTASADDTGQDDTGEGDPDDGVPTGGAADDEWSEDWLSGTWAMAPSALNGPVRKRAAAPEPEPDPEPEPARDDVEHPRPAPRPTARRPARHRYADEVPPPAEPAVGEPSATRPDPEVREPQREPDPEAASLGLRADSVARLSEADRQLLARLQAELLEGRKPGFGRRNGLGNNGSGHNGVGNNGNNGNHRANPPDLAG